MANLTQYPNFFKVYIPRSSSQRMKLPQGFLQRIPQEVIPRKVFLRNRCGVRWTVNFVNIGEDWFFQGDGWVQFVRENNLLEGHFLLFDFHGCDTFEFKIFEHSGWERIGEVNKEAEAKVEFEVVEEEEEKLDEDKSDEDYAPAHQDGMQDEDEDEDEVEEEERKGKGKERATLGFDIYGADIFKSRPNNRPVNPYFVTRLRRSRMSELFIPNDIVKDLNCELPETLIVHDERGKTYRLEADAWNDGRIWYKCRWSRLCRSNCIGEDDKIICEFIKSDEKPSVEMKVSIVRDENS